MKITSINNNSNFNKLSFKARFEIVTQDKDGMMPENISDSDRNKCLINATSNSPDIFMKIQAFTSAFNTKTTEIFKKLKNDLPKDDILTIYLNPQRNKDGEYWFSPKLEYKSSDATKKDTVQKLNTQLNCGALFDIYLGDPSKCINDIVKEISPSSGMDINA